jgi:cytochrome c
MSRLLVICVAAANLLAGAALAQTTVPPVAMPAGDAAKGKNSFGQCQACHSLDASKKTAGPHLAGLIGRKVGSVKGYEYTADYVKAGKAGQKWDEAKLFTYLQAPKAMYPDSKMTWVVKKPEVAANIVAFIKTNPK